MFLFLQAYHFIVFVKRLLHLCVKCNTKHFTIILITVIQSCCQLIMYTFHMTAIQIFNTYTLYNLCLYFTHSHAKEYLFVLNNNNNNKFKTPVLLSYINYILLKNEIIYFHKKEKNVEQNMRQFSQQYLRQYLS